MAVFSIVLGVAYAAPAGRWTDAAALTGFVSLNDGRIHPLAEFIAHLCNPLPFALLATALLVGALVWRGPRRAAAALLLLVGANVSSQVLKPVLAHPRDLSSWTSITQIRDAAFPSGHATAAMSLAFAAVLVAPRAYRPLVAAVGGLFALAVSMSVLILNWHFPSDVIGGQLLAATWCLVALATLRAVNERWPERGTVRHAAREAIDLRALAAGTLVATAVAGALAASRADAIAGFAGRHTVAVGMAALIAGFALALLAGVTALSTRRS